MAKLKPRELAQQAALQGNTDDAVKQLTTLLDGGDAGAAASLADIDAFRGQWSELLRHSNVFLRKPSSVYAGNVFTDVLHLVALAGIKKGAAWSAIQSEAVAIRGQLSADPELKKYVSGDSSFANGIDHLIELARSGGTSPYLWGSSNNSALDEDARAAQFDAGLAKLTAKKNAFKNEQERRQILLALARTYGSHRNAVRVYDDGGIGNPLTFDPIAFTASGLARAGRPEEAWQLVEHWVGLWWPVDVAQVCPVVLLIDEGLRPLMTAERCAWVLSTPRGPAAASKKK